MTSTFVGCIGFRWLAIPPYSDAQCNVDFSPARALVAQERKPLHSLETFPEYLRFHYISRSFEIDSLSSRMSLTIFKETLGKMFRSNAQIENGRHFLCTKFKYEKPAASIVVPWKVILAPFLCLKASWGGSIGFESTVPDRDHRNCVQQVLRPPIT